MRYGQGKTVQRIVLSEVSSVSKFSLSACYTLSPRLSNNQGYNCDRHDLSSRGFLYRTAQWLESISNTLGVVVFMGGCWRL